MNSKEEDGSILTRKVPMECPICGRFHDVEERRRTAEVTVHGKAISYEEAFFRCLNANDDENEFSTGAMENENLKRARAAYAKKQKEAAR